jgi:hypothetical protein
MTDLREAWREHGFFTGWYARKVVGDFMTDTEKERLRAVGLSDWVIEMAEMPDDDGGYWMSVTAVFIEETSRTFSFEYLFSAVLSASLLFFVIIFGPIAFVLYLPFLYIGFKQMDSAFDKTMDDDGGY